jgi:hypothetical protein
MTISDTFPRQNEDIANKIGNFLFTLTPRLIVAAIAGYYSLGVAYEMGMMASIDRVAIIVLKDLVGYAGIGAAMPTFQWYSAWAVRVVAAAGAGLLYDIFERSTICVYHRLHERFHGPVPRISADAPAATLTTYGVKA